MGSKSPRRQRKKIGKICKGGLKLEKNCAHARRSITNQIRFATEEVLPSYIRAEKTKDSEERRMDKTGGMVAEMTRRYDDGKEVTEKVEDTPAEAML